MQGAQLRHRRRQQQQAQQQQQHPGMLPHGLANMLRQQQLQHGALPPHLAEALRRHDAAVAAAAGAPAAAGAAAVAGRAVPGQAPRRPMLNVVVRLNMRALLQLLVLTVVVYQHCPPGRFLMLVGAGLLLYLTATEPVRRFLNRLAGVQQPVPQAQRAAQPPQQPEGAAAGPAAPGGAEQPANAAAAPAAAAGQAAAGAAAGAPAAGEQEDQARQPAAGQGQGQRQQAQQAQHPHRGGLLRELQALVVGFFTSLIPGELPAGEAAMSGGLER